ncbi:unnamed protein product [Closterium sp. NIES-65]|nr:unnamed protein product [Closterium sp. NIES-65]
MKVAGDNQHGQLGRPAPSQDGTPAPVQGLEHLEVLLVVAGSQQGLVLCRALQGSEAALEPQEFDDTRVLNEEHVSPASLPDLNASAPAAAVPVPGGAGGVGAGFGAAVGVAVGAAGGAVRAMVAGGEGTAVASAAEGGDSGAGENWGERVGGGASAAEQGGTGGGSGAGHVDEVWGGVQDAAPAGHGQQHAEPVLARAGGGCGGEAGTQDLYRKLTSSIITGIFPAAIPNPQCLFLSSCEMTPCISFFFECFHQQLNRSPLSRPPFSASLPLVLSPPATQQPPSSSPHSHSPPSPPLVLLNFNPLKNPCSLWDRNGARDFAWYVALFDEAAQHMVNTGGSAVTGEASSTLLTSSGVVLRGHVDDRHTLPQLLHLVLPRSKFIVILRNPVDRFFSEFNLAAAVNPSPSVPRDFHKYCNGSTSMGSTRADHQGSVSAGPPFAGPAAEQMVWKTWVMKLCSPAGSSPSHRAFLSGPSPPPHALAFVPARLVSLSTSPCSSLAAAASLATVPMLLPFLAADDLRASACLRRLLFPAAAGREASGIRRSPSSPIALAGHTSVPPRRAPLAAGRASLMSWAPPRVLLPAASGGWLRVARPPILPCASAACPAIVRRLRPSPLVPGATRVREG